MDSQPKETLPTLDEIMALGIGLTEALRLWSAMANSAKAREIWEATKRNPPSSSGIRGLH